MVAHRLLLLLLRRRSSAREALRVGNVVSVEAWKRSIRETYGHTTARAKSLDRVLLRPICFPATASGQHRVSTARVKCYAVVQAGRCAAGGRAAVDRSVRTRGRASELRSPYRWKAPFTGQPPQTCRCILLSHCNRIDKRLCLVVMPPA